MTAGCFLEQLSRCLGAQVVVISGCSDHSVRVWDLATAEPVGDPFMGHTGAVESVAVGELHGWPVVVSGSSDHSVRVWDLATGEPVGDPFMGHTGAVESVAVGELDGLAGGGVWEQRSDSTRGGPGHRTAGW